LIDSELLKTG